MAYFIYRLMTESSLPSSLILRPKIRVPRLRPQLVIRTDLFDRLSAGWWRKLTLVCAQPGSGKTTLLAAWVSRLDVPTAWLTLDANDNSLERFLAHLAAAIDAAVPGCGQQAFGLLTAPQPLEAESMINVLINAIDRSGRHLVLVLDDYHTISLTSIHEAVIHLIEQLPEGMRLVVVSRSEPPFPLARLRAKDQVTELRSEDLRFKNEEAVDFLNRVMELSLDRTDVVELEKQTEGWITGLQLAALALQAQNARQHQADPARLVKSISGSHRYILDYLTEEVLHQQPEDIQSFLLETSILERMNGAMCQAVTGREDSAALLRRLDQAHLFIQPMDDENEWFRYHTLFADLLRFQLERSQGPRVEDLRRKAAHWLEQNGYHVEAINQYLSLKDYHSAARLADLEGGRLLMQGQVALFSGWFNHLPDAVFQAMPSLYLVYVCGLVSVGQFWLVEERLQKLEGLLESTGGGADISGDIAAIRAIVAGAEGRHQAAIDQSYQALKDLPESSLMRCSVLIGLGAALTYVGRLDEAVRALVESSRLAMANGQNSVVVSALGNKGNIELAQGKLRQGLQTFEAVIEFERGLPDRIPIIAMAHLGIAGLHYEWNELGKAQECIHEGMRRAEEWGYVEVQALARIRLALVYLAEREPGRAAQYMQQAEDIIRAGHLVGDPSGYLNAARLEYLLRSGQLSQAARAAGEFPEAFLLLVSHDLPLAIAKANVWLFQAVAARDEARLVAVRHHLEAIRAAAERDGQVGILLQTWIAQAVLHASLGEASAAQDGITQALEIAAPEGYIRTFIAYGSQAAVLIRKSLPASENKAYLQKLLDAFDAEIQREPMEQPASNPLALDEPASEAEAPEPLSQREIEVLRLAAEGLSNQQIAAQLMIAEGTVKRHLHNIFEKLNAGTRPRAIALARKYRLI